MDSLILTGASGFLGNYIFQQAVDSYDVLGTYNQNPISQTRGKTIQTDLTDPPFGELREFDPDVIVHCAALSDVDQCERNPELAHNLNVEMTESVASLAASVNAHLVYLSTDAVFNGRKSWWSEANEPDPINEYGRTKLAGERSATRLHDDVSIVRTNFVGYTPADRQSLAEWMIDTLESGEELTGFEDVYFTPLYAGDLASYILDLIEAEYTGRIHLSGSERISKLGFAREIADIFGFDSDLVRPIQVDDLDLDAPRGRDLSLNSARAQEVLEEELPDVRTTLQHLKAEGDND
jgi:dTDP-4-dehydrorhamnose reductase